MTLNKIGIRVNTPKQFTCGLTVFECECGCGEMEVDLGILLFSIFINFELG